MYKKRILHGGANIWSLTSSEKKNFTSERNERMKSFFHEKINFECSNQRVIFFLLHRYECFENKKKIDEKQRKNKEMTSAISSLERIWKMSYSYPGCSFVWKIRVVYFSVKHSYLCNKNEYIINKRNMHSNKHASDSDDSVTLTILFSKVRVFTVHSFIFGTVIYDPCSVNLTHLKQLLNPIVY